jgi:hypothetical protein
MNLCHSLATSEGSQTACLILSRDGAKAAEMNSNLGIFTTLPCLNLPAKVCQEGD